MLTRDKLVLAFEQQNGGTVSGQVLARKLGVSRTSVWKHIQSLQKEGIPFEGTARSGYRLGGIPDFSLVSPRFSPRVASWVHLHHYFAAASSQGLAKAGATAGLGEGHLWITEVQRSGRGRLDRVWESPFGGLWFSLLLRPKLAPSNVPPLTLFAALALAESVREVSGVEAKLKWPNDLVVGKKKLAGILTEMSGQMDRTDWVVIGVGMNVNNHLSAALTDRAVSLLELTGKPIERAKLLDRFLARFQPGCRRLEKEGFESFQSDYWKHYSRPDEEVSVRTSQGEIRGIARGVDAHGALIVESRRNLHHLSEGEIVL